VLDPSRPAHVVQEICQFVQRLAPHGALNGLSQMVLRLTSPGIPDLYQGTEFWDFSMVDPDNRRPVDYEARHAALAPVQPPETLMKDWRDGRVKQSILHGLLALRARRPALFAGGNYQKLRVEGPASEHVIAYARQLDEQIVITIASRLSAGAVLHDGPCLPATFWKGTFLYVPRSLHGRQLFDVLRADPYGHPSSAPAISTAAGRVRLETLMATLPVAVLEG
jgi:maltooligosyltrehalose synthase